MITNRLKSSLVECLCNENLKFSKEEKVFKFVKRMFDIEIIKIASVYYLLTLLMRKLRHRKLSAKYFLVKT